MSMESLQAVVKPPNGTPFAQKPVLVFWEVTRACLLSCVHCRASAIREALPGELTYDEGLRLIDQVASFGKPSPTIIFTGGDPLLRRDIFDLLAYASKIGVKFAVSPAVTELLNYDSLRHLKDAGTIAISISLDGSSAQTHDSIRRVAGTYESTIRAITNALSLHLNPQINTTVMKGNFKELPQLFHLIKTLGVRAWELFFLVKVGRGSVVEDLTPEETESVCNFLYDASMYGMTIRTVEGPFIRRVLKQRLEREDYWKDVTYLKLKSELERLEGKPTGSSTFSSKGTLDGDGIIFVGYDGTIHPGGLVPVGMGNVKVDNLVETYRQNELLLNVRSRNMNGYCGICEFRESCGGSRARAYSYEDDPLGSDPACLLCATSNA